MNWLARLKKIEAPPNGEPTETTKRVSVVFVGTPTGHIQKTGGGFIGSERPGTRARPMGLATQRGHEYP